MRESGEREDTESTDLFIIIFLVEVWYSDVNHTKPVLCDDVGDGAACT